MVAVILKAERLHILKNRSNEDSCNMKICPWHCSKSTDWLFSFSRRSSSQSNYSDRRSSCESKDAHQHSQLPSTGGLKSPRCWCIFKCKRNVLVGAHWTHVMWFESKMSELSFLTIFLPAFSLANRLLWNTSLQTLVQHCEQSIFIIPPTETKLHKHFINIL